MANLDYSWMYTANEDEIELYFAKLNKLHEMRDAVLSALLEVNFGKKGFSYNFFDCISGGFYDANIYGNGIYEQVVIYHDTMFEDVKRIREEIAKNTGLNHEK